jgi:hypothetical protein
MRRTISWHPESYAANAHAALHWMKRPEGVLSGVWSSLKFGFVGEFDGKGNVATIRRLN